MKIMEYMTPVDGNHGQQADSQDGIMLVDKAESETSFSIVKKTRKVIKGKKIGHAGTLDPFATGLLIILVGQGTKLAPYIMTGEKRYRATIHLGVETDTLDPTGCVVQRKKVPTFGFEQIEAVISNFIGEIDQAPPIFSAVKYGGKRSYILARKGINVEIQKRKVRIRSIEILSIDLPEIVIEIYCSSGTYIRSLAADIGKALGTGAHLTVLRRLASGSFNVKGAIQSRFINDATPYEYIAAKIIPLRDSLPDMKEIHLNDRITHKIINGYRPKWEEIVVELDGYDEYTGYIKLVNGTALIAVLEINRMIGENPDWLKKIRVFH